MKKVWEILKKDKWTKEGQIEIEELYNVILRIIMNIDDEDILALSDGLNEHLYEVMNIFDEYLSEIYPELFV